MSGLRAIGIAVLAISISAVCDAAEESSSNSFTPPIDRYSWVQLNTGEWLKGDITAMYDEVLVFDSDHFGELQIDLGDIETIHGSGSFALTFGLDAPVRGKLLLSGEDVIVSTASGDLEFTRDELISITPAAERERDRWKGDVGVGLNVRDGNTDIREATVSVGLVRRTPVSRFTMDYLGSTNETDGERITDSHRVNFSADRFSGRRWYWRPISAQYYRDEFQNIGDQFTFDTGIGYHLVDTRRTEWDLTAGAGGNYLSNVSVAPGEDNNQWSPVGTLGSDLIVDITADVEFELLIGMTFLEQKAGRYQHHIVSTLSTDLLNNLDLDVSLIWDRTAEPQVDELGETPEKDDYHLTVELVYDF